MEGVSPWRILQLARPERRRLLLGTLCLVVGSGAGLVYPQAIRLVLDEAQSSASQGLIDKLAWIMVAVAVVQSAAVACRHYLFTTAGERIVATLRRTVFEALLQHEVSFFDQRKTGELLNRLSSDTTVLQNTVSVNISMALRSAATTLGGVAFLFWTSPELALFILLVLPPIVIGAVVYGRSLRRLGREVQDALARASELAEESVAGIRTVRVFTAEERQARLYGAAIERGFDLARRRSFIGAAFVALVSSAGLAAAVGVLWYGGSLVVDRQLSVGELTAFLVYTIIVAASLGTLSDLWADFMKASGAATRVFELVDNEFGEDLAVAPTRRAREGGHYRLEDVSFSYPSRPDRVVLSNVTIDLQPNSVTALVGPSGSGKSTVASLLCRLYDPDSGVIRLDGSDIRTLNAHQYRQRLGVVNQEPILFSTSVLENLRLAQPTADEDSLREAAASAYADEFISAFPDGYATEVGERGIQLSGGQKQRVAIARALLRDPDLLVLDEATSALDSESEYWVKQALSRLMQGRTTLVIAHRLSTVRDADQVLVLDDGRIVQVGSHDHLVAVDGVYKQLVERQFLDAESAATP